LNGNGNQKLVVQTVQIRQFYFSVITHRCDGAVDWTTGQTITSRTIGQMRPEVKCRLRTGKGVGLVLGFMLRVRDLGLACRWLGARSH